MGYVVEEADYVNRADWTDETDVAEMALRMNALFYFDCLGRQELKNMAQYGLWELYAVTWSYWMDGSWVLPLRLSRLLLEHLH